MDFKRTGTGTNIVISSVPFSAAYGWLTVAAAATLIQPKLYFTEEW